MRRALLLAVAIAAVAVFTGVAVGRESVPADGPVLTTAYLDRLRVVAARVDAGAEGIAGLPLRTDENVATLIKAGKKLEASAAAARDMLRTYRDATTRYGTDEEWRTVQAMLGKLQAARSIYEQRAQVRLPKPSAASTSRARTLFDAAAAAAAEEAIARWTGETGLAAALTTGGLRNLDDTLVRELRNRLRSGAEAAIADATGMSVSLGLPLGAQIRVQAERLATRWLARVAFNLGPEGFIVQLAGTRVVHWVGETLRKAFRHSGNAVGRAQATIDGFAALRSQMTLAPPTWPLRNVRSLAARVQRELGRTGYLELDLRRTGEKRWLAELEQAKELTRVTLERTFRPRFLLDQPMARADLNALVDRVKRVLADVQEITRRLAAGAKAEPAPHADCMGTRGISGTWQREGGGIWLITGGRDSVSWIGKSAADPWPGDPPHYFFYQHFTGKIVDGCFIVGHWEDDKALSVMKNSGDIVLQIESPTRIVSIPKHGSYETKPPGSLVLTRK